MSCSRLLCLPPLRLRRAPLLLLRPPARWLSGYRAHRSLQESYRLLQLPEGGGSTPAQVKEAYLRLAKQYHPDSGTAGADAGKFSQLEVAYRAVLAHLAQQREPRRREAEEAEQGEEEDRSRLQAPQHRQYLSFEGVGYGTPSQRERQYRQIRVNRATDQVLEYRRRELERQCVAEEGEGALAAQEVRRRSRQAKITQAVERLVEDLIQESMSRGDFRNLSGAGRPLQKFSHNPYVDPMTHNLNRILIDNGYQPRWIVAQKEIRETLERLRAELLAARGRLGDPPLPAEQRCWQQHRQAFAEELAQLNKKVDGFNLIVPLLSRQMVHFSVEKELSRAVSADQQRRAERERAEESQRKEQREERREEGRAGLSGLLSWIQSLLK
ncbi:dnaJ homolog subfamily C member 28 [Amia ocellicauda]|uniref:dnaJ homolog subfamily C member 28 n=1 Tax=Amia ocellicauda TaxID=2972642 RepID=UPI00346412A6